MVPRPLLVALSMRAVIGFFYFYIFKIFSRFFNFCFLFGMAILLGHLGGSKAPPGGTFYATGTSRPGVRRIENRDIRAFQKKLIFSKYFRDFLFLFSDWDLLYCWDILVAPRLLLVAPWSHFFLAPEPPRGPGECRRISKSTSFAPTTVRWMPVLL